MARRWNRGNFSFSNIPTVRYARSKFNLSYGHKTTMNVGDLVPFHVQEVYPGDSFSEKAFFVDRTSNSFLRVPMDNLMRDTYFFFVPSRLVMDDWSVLIANENKVSYWAPPQAVTAPQIVGVNNPTAGSINPHHVLAYMGAIPVGGNISSVSGSGQVRPPMHSVSALPVRAFALIYNEWFRNENFINYLAIPKDNLDCVGVGSSNVNNAYSWSNNQVMATSPNAWTGVVPKVSKRPDYFTSCLPAPQKGSPVQIPLLGVAPVLASVNTTLNEGYGSGPLRFGVVSGGVVNSANFGSYQTTALGFGSALGELAPNSVDEAGIGVSSIDLAPLNLYANLSSVTATDINSLRFAFATQRMLEKDARGGSRYTEMLSSHFGCTSPDLVLQRPEFLGGSSNPISIQQVAQTSQGTTQSSLASLGSFSLSNGAAGYSKSFTEHGFVIGVTCIRQMHTYQQGINRMWFKKERYDFYDPLFSHLGEQPVYTKELYADADENTIFGYNEYGADLRWKPSRVSGQLSSKVSNSLDIWTFADLYSNEPVLNQTFIEETPTYVDRTLAVPSTSQDQFISDIYISSSAIRVMPTYSVPGLIDHDTTR